MRNDRPWWSRLARRGQQQPSRERARAQALRPLLEGCEERLLLSFAPLPGEVFLTPPSREQPLEIAVRYLAEKGSTLGVSGADLQRMKVTDLYTSNPSRTTYIYLRQMYNGLEVINSNINVAVTRHGQIVAAGGSFSPVIGQLPETGVARPLISPRQALASAAFAFELNYQNDARVEAEPRGLRQNGVLSAPSLSSKPIPFYLEYVADEAGQPRLAWNLNLDLRGGFSWLDLSVDAETGQITRWADWVANAAYRVFAQPKASPLDGARTLEVDPHLRAPNASPFGWHDTDGATGAEFTDTRGNNVFAQEDTNADNTGGNRPDGGSGLVFDFQLDLTRAPDTYQDAAITNLFYWNNIIHDVLYQYGFDEVAGNFQENNYGKGGLGNDAVRADAQDGSGTNNANFATPPDGTPGRMQMFLWNITTPNRDSDLDNEVIAHEYGHGVSNRLTGGPSNASALASLQSGSMGEGWSDFFALWFTQLTTDRPNDPYTIAGYVLPGAGVRRFPYSFDTNIYPLTYGDTAGFSVHANGEIWNSALWDLNWLLIERQGFDADLYKGVDLTNPDSAGGNQIAMLLVLEGMKTQPVRPTYLQARNAILQADLSLFNGKYSPQIWTAFARRGMGFSARDTGNPDQWNVIESFDVPNFVQLTFNPITYARENVALNNVVVGRLTDRASLGSPDEYFVTVDWGDGRGPLPARLVPSGTSGYNIVSSVEYAEGGTYSVVISADRQGSLPTILNSTLSVASEPIFVTPGPSITAREDDPASSYLIATFQDLDPVANPVSHYRALIDWGDGFQTFGQIFARPDGRFEVRGNHSFLEGGRFPVTVLVSEGGGNTATGEVPAEVQSYEIFADGVGTINAREGVAFSGVVATFFDQDPGDNTVSNYVATITWQTGVTAPGTIVRVGPNQFQVRGSYLFSRGPNGQSTVPISVSVRERGGNQATAISNANVADAPISPEGIVINTTEGNFSGVVARFTDFNPAGRAEEFGANVVLASGPPVPGRIRATGQGGFEVLADLRVAFGNYPVRVDIFDLGGGSTGQANSQMVVADAPISPRGVPVVKVEGSPFTGRVASFTDGNPNGRPEDFQALIDWGNGTSTPGQIVRDSNTFAVIGSITYAFGTYPINVTILSVGSGLRYAARSTATITDAPLNGTAFPIQATELVSTRILVGEIVDTNPIGRPDELSVSINWGDGQTSPGQVVLGSGGKFIVQATKAFNRSGDFPVVATVSSVGGAQAVLNSTARVGVLMVPVSGGLKPASDSGLSNTDGITANRSPVFQGNAAPGSVVKLVARGPQGTPINLGEVQANPTTGAWSLAAAGLTDGTYTVIASATNRSGRPSSPEQILNGGAPVIIDTKGPRVADVFLDGRRGQVLLRLADQGGLDAGTLGNPSAYSFTDVNGRAIRIRGVDVMGPNSDGSRTVVLSVGNGRSIRPGGYVVGVDGQTLRDVAGNSLTEDFYTPFPQLGRQESSMYLAQVGTNGTGSTAPLQYVPPRQLRGAALFRRLAAAGFRTRPLI